MNRGRCENEYELLAVSGNTQLFFSAKVMPALWNAYNAAVASIDLYVCKGCHPGGFLVAVLANDLRGAFGCADDHSACILKALVTFCYNGIPGDCWGSWDRVNAWMASRGLAGRSDRDSEPSAPDTES